MKRSLSIILAAVLLVLSVWQAPVRVLAAEAFDLPYGWNVTEGNTVTEDEYGMYDISLGELGRFGPNVQYAAQLPADILEISFIPNADVGIPITMALAPDSVEMPIYAMSNYNGAALTLVFETDVRNNTLKIVVFDALGNVEPLKTQYHLIKEIAGFYPNAEHKLYFVQSGTKWHIALDDHLITEYDCSGFINGIIASSPEKTCISISGERATPFEFKMGVSQRENSWQIPSGNQVLSTAENTWQIDYNTPGRASQNTLTLCTPLPVNQLSVQMNSNLIGSNKVFILSIDNKRSMPIYSQGNGQDAAITFLIEYKDKNSYIMIFDYTLTDPYVYHESVPYTAENEVTLSFVKLGDEWHPQVSGKVLNYDCSLFVASLLSVSGQSTYINISSDIAYDMTFKIAEKSKDIFCGKNVSVSNETNGNHQFEFRDSAAWPPTADNTAIFSAEASLRDIALSVDLSHMAVSDRCLLQFSDEGYLPIFSTAQNGGAFGMIFERMGEQSLRIGSYSSTISYTDLTVDFSRPHIIKIFSVGAQEYIAFDDSMIAVKGLSGILEKIESAFYRNAVIAVSGGRTGFGVKIIEGNNTHLLPEGSYANDGHSVFFYAEDSSGTCAWPPKRQAVYQTDIPVKELEIEVWPHYTDNKSVIIQLGSDAAAPLYAGNYNKGVCLILEKRDEGTLFLASFDQTGYPFNTVIHNFNFNVPHQISFKQSGQKWHLVLDETEYTQYDFSKALNSTQNGNSRGTVVGLSAQCNIDIDISFKHKNLWSFSGLVAGDDAFGYGVSVNPAESACLNQKVQLCPNMLSFNANIMENAAAVIGFATEKETRFSVALCADGEQLNITALLPEDKELPLVKAALQDTYSLGFEKNGLLWRLVLNGTSYEIPFNGTLIKNLDSFALDGVYCSFAADGLPVGYNNIHVVSGDVNSDGTKNGADLICLRKRLLGIAENTSGYFNVNGDNAVDIRDLVALKKMLVSCAVPPTRILTVGNYGAAGDGETDDSAALLKSLAAAREIGAPAFIEFESNASYYFNQMSGRKAIFELYHFNALTLIGDNTTMVMDMSNNLKGYADFERCNAIEMKGFNFKTAKPVYALSDVLAYNDKELTIDIKTDISLDITETYLPEIEDFFGLPLTDYNRAHMYIEKISVLDAQNNTYRVHFKDMDNLRHKINSMLRDNLRFIVPMPGWAQIDFSGMFIVTNNNNLTLSDINIWSAHGFVFHMRYNSRDIRMDNVNLTSEPGTDSVMCSWRDGMHLKENRGRFIIENCRLEKCYDDIFNFSVTAMYINQVYNPHEFNLFCEEFDGIFWAPLRVGDTLQLYDETNATFFQKVKIKRIVSQSGSNNRIIIDRDLPGLTQGLTVSVLDLGQPGSEINNCYINGTWRFATPLTARRCTFDTIFAWIQNIVNVEGPVPERIRFEECSFRHIRAPQPQDSFINDNHMILIGINTRNPVVPKFNVSDIVFENCNIHVNEVELSAPATGVTFISSKIVPAG